MLTILSRRDDRARRRRIPNQDPLEERGAFMRVHIAHSSCRFSMLLPSLLQVTNPAKAYTPTASGGAGDAVLTWNQNAGEAAPRPGSRRSMTHFMSPACTR
jgi:hypothetical protein